MSRCFRAARYASLLPVVLSGALATAYAGTDTPEPVVAPPVTESIVEVNGSTISWTDNGWYIVQSASDFITQCEGEVSCDVEDGIYIVINLTTQERFENVQVGEAVADSPLPVSEVSTDVPVISSTVDVNGSTISWSDNGWYIVQSATDFSTLCEGGTSCDVADGTYIVANLTTQERFENIVVGEAAVEPTTPLTPPVTDVVESVVVVNGSEISWPDNGWYIVQNAADFSTVSEGQRSCIVPDGTYIVINLTTQERFENVVVGSTPSKPVVAQPVEPVVPVEPAPPVVVVPPVEPAPPVVVVPPVEPTPPVEPAPPVEPLPVVDDENLPAINAGNFRVLVSEAFRVLSGQAIDERIVQFPYLRGDNPQSCASGSNNLSATSLATGTVVYNLVSTVCRYEIPGIGNSDQVNGTLTDTNSPIGHAHNYEFINIRTNNDMVFSANGSFSSFVGGSGETVRIEALNYSTTTNDIRTQYSSVDSFLFRPFTMTSETARFEGDVTINSPVTRFLSNGVEIVEPFEYNREDVIAQGIDPDAFQTQEVRNSIRFARGILEIRSRADSSTIVLDANTGDFDTVSVTVSNSIGLVELTVSWDEWQADLAGNITRPFSER